VVTFKHSNIRTVDQSDGLIKAILLVLFFGPLIAPLFQATQLPLVADSGALARDLLSRYICPTPAKSYMLLGFPMAVCARCWGATIGLWAAWYMLRPPTPRRRSGQATDYWSPSIVSLFVIRCSPFVRQWLNIYVGLASPTRLLLGALPFLLWVAEISLWAAAPYWLLLLNGAFVGFWAGLFFYSILPGLLENTTYAVTS
jgi:hypothetical protein